MTPCLPPMAWTRFALNNPDEAKPCIGKAGAFAELKAVNNRVNRGIRAEVQHEDVAFERWMIWPQNGDCNDFAVTKRHELLKAGWPSSALLLAECIVPTSGEHHLVLLATDNAGRQWVLDILPTPRGSIRRPEYTGYVWCRMQSTNNPNYWKTRP